MKKIGTVLIGYGYRGQMLYDLMKKSGDYRICAVFDPSSDDTEREGVRFFGGESSRYRSVIETFRPELTVIASPWDCHTEQILFALKSGSAVAAEIRGGLSFGEYRQITQTVALTGVPLFPLENMLFGREIQAMLHFTHRGGLGEPVAFRGGYRHDLRPQLVSDEGRLGNPSKPEGLWRGKLYTERNGDLYPSHGLAPLCLASGIGRSDRVAEITAVSSLAVGLNTYIREKGGMPEPVTTGDIVMTHLKTEKGVLLTLTHDTTLPRPRGFDFEWQGTKGIWRGETRQIYVEGESPYEQWESDSRIIDEYETDLWKRYGREATEADRHHGGMDYMMLKCLAGAVRGTDRYPVSAADLELWTSVSFYSEMSLIRRRTVFPDSPDEESTVSKRNGKS